MIKLKKYNPPKSDSEYFDARCPKCGGIIRFYDPLKLKKAGWTVGHCGQTIVVDLDRLKT
jgi:hypothetical protein